jgi:hypothetical protein
MKKENQNRLWAGSGPSAHVIAGWGLPVAREMNLAERPAVARLNQPRRRPIEAQTARRRSTLRDAPGVQSPCDGAPSAHTATCSATAHWRSRCSGKGPMSTTATRRTRHATQTTRGGARGEVSTMGRVLTGGDLSWRTGQLRRSAAVRCPSAAGEGQEASEAGVKPERKRDRPLRCGSHWSGEKRRRQLPNPTDGGVLRLPEPAKKVPQAWEAAVCATDSQGAQRRRHSPEGYGGGGTKLSRRISIRKGGKGEREVACSRHSPLRRSAGEVTRRRSPGQVGAGRGWQAGPGAKREGAGVAARWTRADMEREGVFWLTSGPGSIPI